MTDSSSLADYHLMPIHSQRPTKTLTTQYGHDECIRKDHPAFGMVRLSRISGGEPILFGSEIKWHTGSIRLTIMRGHEEWHLSEKRYVSDDAIVEIDMSEAQFAALITSFNIGAGVPCTLNRTESCPRVVGIEDDGEDLHSMIRDDIATDGKKVMANAAKLVKELKTVLGASTLSKAKQQSIIDLADTILRDITSNMPFVVDQYTEGMDKLKAHAMAEVDGFATRAALQLGFKSLRQLGEMVNAELAGETKNLNA